MQDIGMQTGETVRSFDKKKRGGGEVMEMNVIKRQHEYLPTAISIACTTLK